MCLLRQHNNSGHDVSRRMHAEPQVQVHGRASPAAKWGVCTVAAIGGGCPVVLSSGAMSEDSTPQPSTDPSAQTPLSLGRLREAFAAMLGPPTDDAAAGPDAAADDATLVVADQPADDGRDPCEISPRSVVEAMLFVGRPDGRPLSARELAAAMRGVSPREIDAAVADLNTGYQLDSAPYEITGSSGGYHLRLRDEFARMRDKLHGQVREAKLSPAAVEVLSIVAYNQPVTSDEVSQLRGAASGAVLSTLVRRRLVRLERPADRKTSPTYHTTERFLRLFGLESITALPRSEELEKA